MLSNNRCAFFCLRVCRDPAGEGAAFKDCDVPPLGFTQRVEVTPFLSVRRSGIKLLM